MTVGWEEEEEEEEEMGRGRRRRRVPECPSLVRERLYNEVQHSQRRPSFFVKLRSASQGEEWADETQKDQALRPK